MKALKWLGISVLVLLGIVILLYLAWTIFAVIKGDGFFQGHIEKHYLTYKAFENSDEYRLANFAIPQDSQEIDYYAWLAFDTNYHFVQANVNCGDDLTVFIKQIKQGMEVEFDAENVVFRMSSFDELFSGHNPKWWNKESMQKFTQNYLLVKPYKNSYGSGLWYFYDKDNHMLRVFKWSEQHLSNKQLKEALLRN